MTVTRDTMEELARQRAEIDAILDSRRIAATAQWEASWGRMQDELTSWADAWADIAEAQLRAGRNPYRLVNLRAMRQVAEDELRGNLDVATRLDREGLGRLTMTAGQHAAQLAGSQLPRTSRGAIAWLPTNPAALEAIVKRATQQITARHYYLSREATRSVRSALRLGMAAGDNPRTVARDMIRRTEGVFNGGLARAEVIARTELLDGYRNATNQAYVANRDVLDGWQWLAELSERTCPACLSMNGTMWPVNEPGPMDHHCGRCTSVPVIKPLNQLGIGGPEPRSAVPDSLGWFKSQPEAVQRQIMGPGRYDAWLAGRFPPERWAQRVETDGWRDAFHVGKPAAPSPTGGSTGPATVPPPPSAFSVELRSYGSLNRFDDDALDGLLNRACSAGDADAMDLIAEEMDLRDQLYAADRARQAEAARQAAAAREAFARDMANRTAQARRLTAEQQLRASYAEYLETAYLQAEADCRGVLLSAEAKARGISSRSLFQGQSSRALKWASEELRSWWQKHGRLTYAAFKQGAQGGAGGALEAARLIQWNAPGL
jgi:SPP1 gp7 family putative phage head morphogenesis protein